MGALTMFTFLYACLTAMIHADDVNVTDANLTSLSRELLEDLCPYVDICDPDATSAELRPNGRTGKGFMSCCKGCSCHPDCKEKRNCCHPEEESKEIHDDPSDSLYRCEFTRLANPNKLIMDTTPSYRTIVFSPMNGCVSTGPLKNQATGMTYQPSCDDVNFAPWGSFYPAFSKNTGEIYKNLQCAYCHGASDAELFTAVLVCEKFDGRKKKLTSLNEQLDVFLTGQLSPKCRVDFFYRDPSQITNQRCFKRIIDSCLTNFLRFPMGKNTHELDFVTVRNFCEAGVRSPVTTDHGIYRNVFCTLCGQPTRFYSLNCEDDAQKSDDVSFAQVLDSRVVIQQAERKLEPRKDPEVCLENENAKDPVKCRIVHCPSGRIRDREGNCVVASTNFNSGGMMVQIKLTPDPDDQPIGQLKEMIGKDEILTSSVWPANWKLINAFRRVDESDCSERAVVIACLATEVGHLETIIDEVQKTLKKQWVINVDNASLTLKQSLLEYPLTVDLKAGISASVPYWQKHEIDLNSTKMYSDCDSIVWKAVFLSITFRRPPFIITKLFLCQQVQLGEHEFEIGFNGYYLQSNLTKTLLHEYEYDLIEVNDGFAARVCPSDTIFTVKRSNSETRLNFKSNVLLVVLGIQLVTSYN